VLRRVPAGFGDVIGTPSAAPCATREAALAEAERLLGAALAVEASMAPEEAARAGGESRPAFDLDGVFVTLDPGFRRRIAPEASRIATRELQAWLFVRLVSDFPDGITGEGFRALPAEARNGYLGAIAVLLSRGVLRLRRGDVTVVPDA